MKQGWGLLWGKTGGGKGVRKGDEEEDPGSDAVVQGLYSCRQSPLPYDPNQWLQTVRKALLKSKPRVTAPACAVKPSVVVLKGGSYAMGLLFIF